MIAKRLGAFVRPGQVPEVWNAVAELFRDYGYRRLRHRARIKFLIADWGPEKFREVLEKEYLGYALPDGPAPVNVAPGGRDHIGVHRQRDGLNYVGFAPRVGRLNGELLGEIATLAERYGSGRVRTTTEQKMVIIDVPDASVHALVAELEELGLPVGAQRLPAAHDGLHRDRVLQARDRGDQGARDGADRRAREAAAGLRLAGDDQRQRLPELLRSHSDS